MSELITNIIALLKAQLNNNQFLSGGLILGFLGSTAYSLRAIPIKIWNRIHRRLTFEVTVEQNDDLYPWLQCWLNTHYKKQLRNVKASFWRVPETQHSGNGDISIRSSSKKTLIKENEIVYNHYGDTFTIFFNNRFIKISSQKDKMENASSWESLFFERYYLSGFLSKKAIMNLLKEVTEYNIANEKNNLAPKIKYNSYDNWDYDKQARMRDLNNIFLPENVKSEFILDLQSFLDERKFYIDRNIPYRRGYLLHGPPGTGKSSLVSAVAKHFKRDLYVLNMKSVESDSTFHRLMSYIGYNGILLIEDIDGYFDGRKAETKVNFSSFLNEISGVKAKEDMILIITTNHVSKIDQAILRSGRIDKRIEIGLPTSAEINKYLSWFYNIEINLELEDVSYTMADVENICIQNKFDHNSAIDILLSKQIKVAKTA